MATVQRLNRELARRLREERRRLGLTQESLAEKAGVSANFLAHLERGTRGVSLETLCRLAEAMSIQPASLLSHGPAPRGSGEREQDIRRLAVRLKGLGRMEKQLVLHIAEVVGSWKLAQRGGRRGR